MLSVVLFLRRNIVLTNKDDIKIFILYLMNSIGYPLDRDTLHDIAVQDGFITSFDFIECFDELLDVGNVYEIKANDETGEEKTVYGVTEQGVHVSETLNGRLLLSIREKSLKNALRLLSFKKRGTNLRSYANELPHGKFEFHCVVEENGEELMNLKLILSNRKQLDKMTYNFETQPEFVYKGILALVSGEANYLLN